MFTDGKILGTDIEICEAFSKFFENMFIQPAPFYDNDRSKRSYNNTVSTFNVNEDLVQKLLLNLDVSKGPGSDGIPPSFIVKCAKSLSKPLTIIFFRSIRDGIYPSRWKEAHIVPVHKKGSKTTIEHYRPISILNIFGKVFEKIVYDNIYPVIMQGVPNEQHGFVRGRSTTSNLSVFVSDVLQGMSSHGQVDVVYTDFEKAFDRVDHVILLKKLQELGIHGDLLRWIRSYVTNRQQAVVVGGCRSNFIHVPSGVPQGSLLGPLLYAAFLYDINECFEHSKFLLYADDKKVYLEIKNIEDCVKLQRDLNNLSVYYHKNRIGVNVAKCQQISFSRRNKTIEFNYTLNNNKLTKISSVRDLGVILDAKLTFSAHIESIVNRAYRNLGFVIRTCKPFTDEMCVRMLYFAYVRSTLEYCSSIWNPQYIIYDHSIESIQQKFVKYLNFKFTKVSQDYTESCMHHKLKTLHNRRLLCDMSLLHDICSGAIDCPTLVNNILRFLAPSLRTRNTKQKLFYVPTVRTNYASNCVNFRLPNTYNNKFSVVDIFHLSKNAFKNQIITILNNKL
ncbi:hypothetical protein JYU34_018851 [Plutella xylostella]|uniref:Reverse transcriptase domain-containing protein n=1 Tax=Plutella xylostella TaxID=51655 RepID=A0ABQ7PYY0_PLUXY|nr:hypothetical protein JYU34_018851 [Plutella xylostella]